MAFCDRVKPVGRPRIEENVVNPCLRLTDNTSDPNGCMRGVTVWHKSVESSYGLNIKEVEPIYKQNKKLNTTDIQQWTKIGGICLTNADKESLLSDHYWLNDSIINATQILLQSQYHNINGLQNVLLTEIEEPKLRQLGCNASESSPSGAKRQKEKIIYGLKPIPKGLRFVQIVLDKNAFRNHWIVLSNVTTERPDTVRIYDSDLDRIKRSIENYSERTINAIKRLMKDYEDIKVEIPLVCQQSDRCSGGVFAVAFAQTLCSGKKPSEILFSPDVKQLRSHLLFCLETKNMIQFPLGKDKKIANFVINRKGKKKNKRSRN